MAERDDDLLGRKQGHGFNAPLIIKMSNREASRLVEETEDFLFNQQEGIPNVVDLLDLLEGREENRGYDPLRTIHGIPGIGKTPGNVRRKYSTKPGAGPYDYSRPFSRPFPQASREFKNIWRLSQQGLSGDQFIERYLADEKKHQADQLEKRRRAHSAFGRTNTPPKRQLPGLGYHINIPGPRPGSE